MFPRLRSLWRTTDGVVLAWLSPARLQVRMRKLMLALVAMFAALVVSCRTHGSGGAQSVVDSPATTTDRRLMERNLSIYEAVFRHQFESNASGMKSAAPAYFLSIERRDPPTDFLNRFAGNRPPVRPGSEFRNGLGLLFQVDGIREIDPTTIEVDGGYYEAELSSSGNTYRVHRRGGSWIVISDDMHWISQDHFGAPGCDDVAIAGAPGGWMATRIQASDDQVEHDVVLTDR